MELEFCRSNTNLNSNLVNRIKHGILWIPLDTLIKYFFWNYENIYFLFLSLFQLSTLWFIPRNWSPTGPFSTAIPLLLCIAVEIVTKMINWYKDWNLDKTENNKEYQCLDVNNKTFYKKNKNIYPGDIIYLQKEEICPVDGILIDTSNNEKFSKISLALLTGESNIHYVVKPYKYFKANDYKNTRLLIDEYYPNNFHNIDGKIIKTDKEYKVQGDSFIVAGSIIKSDDVYIWVTACGKDKKGYLKKSTKSDRKKNRIDNFIGKYMMNVNAILLGLLILLTTTTKLIFTTGFSFYNLIFYVIQNWILFNGIIPFSIKIFLILARSLQSTLNNKNNSLITINNSLQIDDIGKIDKILTDKTGTLTKNELEFSKLLEVWKNDIIDVETFEHKHHDISSEFHKCLGLCIHQIEGVFCTEEDKTIRYRYQHLNDRINLTGDKISLFVNNNKYDYKYVEIGGLDFTFERRMSSKIVKDTSGKHYIYCKGALDIIASKVKDKYKDELKRLDKLISSNCPELRLLACAYREVSQDDIKAMNDSVNRSAMIKVLEDDLELLGLIGIKDNLQPDVQFTINRYKQNGLECCLLTGDRKITAIAIAKEAGVIDNENDIFDYLPENKINDIADINKKTLVFSGTILESLSRDNNCCELFYEQLTRCKNFVGYNLIPDHKRKLTNILENKGIVTMTIGDGFNDCGMFDVSSISVAIKGNNYVENNADFSIKEFRNLSNLLDLNIDNYYKNSKLINFTFCRCSTVIFSLVTYCLLNYNNYVPSLFNGFVLQAFNFAWMLPGIGYYVLVNNNDNNTIYKKNDYYRNKLMTYTSYTYTSFWNIAGIIAGITLTLINNSWFHNNEYLSDISGFILISFLNIKLMANNKASLYGILLSLLGIVNFMIYMFFNGTLVGVFNSLMFVNKYYWISLFSTYFLISFGLA